MAIEFKCQNCQKTLRVADEFAGKKARCPNCQTILKVESEVETVEPIEVKPPIAQSSAPYSSQDASPANQSSYGQSSLPNTPPFASANPYNRSPSQPYASSSSRLSGKEHRGGLVLGLGIASFLCSILSFCSCIFMLPAIPSMGVALTLGILDLREMKAGGMDNSGHGMTLTGTIFAGISAAITALAVMLVLVVIIVAIANG